jgi:hypothetical protein
MIYAFLWHNVASDCSLGSYRRVEVLVEHSFSFLT